VKLDATPITAAKIVKILDFSDLYVNTHVSVRISSGTQRHLFLVLEWKDFMEISGSREMLQFLESTQPELGAILRTIRKKVDRDVRDISAYKTCMGCLGDLFPSLECFGLLIFT
ncbi:hypothetical protein PMIN02_011079, partial [Paraphaeosphaeria minitans]